MVRSSVLWCLHNILWFQDREIHLKNLALRCSWFYARTLLPGGAAEVEPWPRRGMTTREKSQEFMRWISHSSESTNSCRNLHLRFLLENGKSKKKPSIFFPWLRFPRANKMFRDIVIDVRQLVRHGEFNERSFTIMSVPSRWHPGNFQHR